ncbi:aspartate aminotransferase family protein [Sansalvadorimonas verongulae]|uniref:aspartate aminotransferase family protein n=1 Tax=Sansalvadorimonas verongulae TaxID=2172824 RepID=UPI0012BC180B|nr:aspartate aminotransferase family protein [Sansalvadorimonas verongulae]MTI13547.1 aspartate aminotransferase family protein [Sansalvadorimonas verongulae]
MTDSLMTTYNRLPVTFTHGEGIWLEDSHGRRYIDALSGIAVCGLGHAHPKITQAIKEQSRRLLHTSNLYGIDSQEKLADRLVDLTGMEKVFFCNSGAEANECAIKIARRYGHSKGIEKPGIVVMDGSFHGRTLATLTATASKAAKQGFGPLLEGFYRVPFNNPKAVEKLAQQSDIVAVLVEPVQGEGGVNIPDTGYLEALREICDENNCLLMLDEIQTGTGRTGHWFACQNAGVSPDVLTTAKGLGNGLPIGACLAKGDAAQMLNPGSHGTTFGGNPLCCATALAVLDTIEQEQLLKNAVSCGQLFLDLFQRGLGDLPEVKNIRGKGLMIAIELDRPCGQLVSDALEAGLLINVTAGNTVRLLPPLIVSRDDTAKIAQRLIPLIKTFLDASKG